MEYINVRPAYGRILRTPKEVQAYYDEGKDFEILSMFHRPGSYIARAEVEAHGDMKLEIRYGKIGEKVAILPKNLKPSRRSESEISQPNKSKVKTSSIACFKCGKLFNPEKGYSLEELPYGAPEIVCMKCAKRR